MSGKQRRGGLVAASITWLVMLNMLSKAQADPPFIFALRRTVPVTTLDYLDAQFTERLVVEAQIMEGLVGFDPQNERLIVPRLAKSYHHIDLYTYVFRLRNDIYFHPHLHGQETVEAERVTPEDVEFSLWRAQQSSSSQQYRLDNVESITVVGPDLVKIKLSKPDDDFLSRLATAVGHVTCRGYYESLGPDDASRRRAFAQAPVGTGPYLLAHPLRDGQPIVLQRFDRYWDRDWARSKTAIDQIEYRYYDSVADILAGLGSGEIGSTNLMLSTFGEGGVIVPKKKPLRLGGVLNLSPPFLSLLAINVTKPELADPLTRELLNAAVDQTKIQQICPSGLPDLPDGYNYYLDIAKRYRQAGQNSVQNLLQTRPHAKDLLRILQKRGALTILVRAGDDVTRDKIIASISGDLERELQLKVKVVPSKQFSAEIEKAKPAHDLTYVDWTPGTPGDGLSILYSLFFSQSQANISHYSDPKVDKLFAQLYNTVDKSTANKLYRTIQDHLLETHPHIWIPTVRSNTILYKKGYRIRIRPSSLVFYTSFIRYAERIHE